MLFSHKIEGYPTMSANMDVWKLKNKTLCFYLESKNNRILGIWMVLILPKAMCLASLTLMGKTDVGKEIVFPD